MCLTRFRVHKTSFKHHLIENTTGKMLLNIWKILIMIYEHNSFRFSTVQTNLTSLEVVWFHSWSNNNKTVKVLKFHKEHFTIIQTSFNFFCNFFISYLDVVYVLIYSALSHMLWLYFIIIIWISLMFTCTVGVREKKEKSAQENLNCDHYFFFSINFILHS